MDVCGIGILIFFAIVITEGQVSLEPSRQVVYADSSPDYLCVSNTPGTTIEWLINGSPLANLPQNDVRTEGAFRGQNRAFEVLIFTNVSVSYNATSIECRAVLASGEVSASAEGVLLVQDIPVPVGAIFHQQVEDLSLFSWTAPFTLPGASEITYCVDVIDSLNRRTLHSQCGLNGTELSYTIPSTFVCRELGVSVTPVNWAGRGTTETKTFPISKHANSIRNAPEVVNANLLAPTEHILVMSAPVCSAELTLANIDTGVKIMVVSLMVTEHSIHLTTEQLSMNHNYNIIVTAFNIAGIATTSARLSTHDVRDIIVTTTNNEVRLYFDYFTHSNASGVFVLLISEDVSHYLALDKVSSLIFTVPFSLEAGVYRVFAYDIETDGALASGVSYPADSAELVLTQITKEPTFQLSYSLLQNCRVSSPNALRVLVQCDYSSDSQVTGFHAIVHQSNFDDAHRLYINKTTDRQTSVIVPVDQGGMYQVAIFSIRGEGEIAGWHLEFAMQVGMVASTETTQPVSNSTETSSSLLEIVLGSGVSVGFVIFVISCCVCGICLYMRWKKWQGSSYQSAVGDEDKEKDRSTKSKQDADHSDAISLPTGKNYETVISAI